MRALAERSVGFFVNASARQSSRCFALVIYNGDVLDWLVTGSSLFFYFFMEMNFECIYSNQFNIKELKDV